MTSTLKTLLVLFALSVFPGGGVASADEPEAFDVLLTPGGPASKLQPLFGPQATETRLAALGKGSTGNHDPVSGRLKLGPEPGDGRPFMLVRSRPDSAYDLLTVDRNGDGSLEGEAPVRSGRREGDTSAWLSFNVVLQIVHADGATEPYPIALWVVVTDKADVPKIARFVPKGYLSGQVRIDGELHDVVLSDGDSDGVYGAGDSWTIRRASDAAGYRRNRARHVGDFAWARGRAFKLELGGPKGRTARLVGVDPGISEEADEKKRDPFYDDRRAARSETPLLFHADIEAGLSAAKQDIEPVLLSFESLADPACYEMFDIIHSQERVVSAATGLTCVRVDLDSDKAFAEPYKVKKVPTSVLLGPNGKELARLVGLPSGDEFLAFLAEVHPYLEPADHEPLVLKGAAKKRHKAEVKALYKYLDDNKQHGLLVDRIGDLGSRGKRASRDALMLFAQKRKSQEYVVAAFDALARIKGVVAIEFLCGKDALGSKDFLVAQNAAEALGEARDPAAIDPIIGVMTNKRTKIEIVHACAIALAKSGPSDERVHAVVFEYTGARKDTIRAGAVEALGYLTGDKAIESLKQFLTDDKNTRVRAAAALGMGHTKRAELIPVLRTAIDADKAHTVRTSALDSIRKIQGKVAK